MVSVLRGGTFLQAPKDIRLGSSGGALAVALSILILSFPQIFGKIGILVLYLIWLPQLVRKGPVLVAPTPVLVLAMALPLWAALSSLWASDLHATLRSAIEFISLIVCVSIVARLVKTDDFIRGGAAASMVGVIGGLFSRGFLGGVVGLHYSMDLIMGSKNQLGMVAALGVLFGLLNLRRLRAHGRVGALGWAQLALGIAVLLHSHSAGATVSAAAAGATACVVMVARRAPASIRRGLLVLLVLGLVLSSAVSLLAIGGLDGALHDIGKSSTLTGRTYLWAMGLKAAVQHPLLGYGYESFWVHGRPMAEQLWYQFSIESRAGFHFHNALVETLVEMGAVGVILLCFVAGRSVLSCLGSALGNRPWSDEALLGLTLMTFFIVRSAVEVDVLGPFGEAAFLFYGVALRLDACRRFARARESAEVA